MADIQIYGTLPGGGGGTSNYNDLDNKPTINNVELSGNKTASDLGLAESQEIITITGNINWTVGGEFTFTDATDIANLDRYKQLYLAGKHPLLAASLDTTTIYFNAHAITVEDNAFYLCSIIYLSPAVGAFDMVVANVEGNWLLTVTPEPMQ